MAERLTSPEEAAVMKSAMDAMIDYLEQEQGLDRGSVGAAMVGFGLAVLQVHRGHRVAMRAIDGARDALLAERGD